MTLRTRLQLAAWLVLIAGLVAAGLIYALTISAPESNADAVASSPQYDYTIERMGGKAALRVAHFNQWVISLTHGTRLAVTLAVLASVIALFCFWLSGLLDDSSTSAPPSANSSN